MSVYGWKSEDEARKHVKVYDAKNGGTSELLKDPDVEAVIIALPLHLHAPVGVRGDEGRQARADRKADGPQRRPVQGHGPRRRRTGHCYLAVGHQRHYSVLYDNAVNLMRWGLLGQLHHIRAQWHRGNLPGKDSWQQPLPGGEVVVGGRQGGRQDRSRSCDGQGSRTEDRKGSGPRSNCCRSKSPSGGLESRTAR